MGKKKKSCIMKLLKYIVNIPFALCVLFLRLLGKCIGATYKQISVMFNLWVQGGILVLSALMPLLQFLDHSSTRDTFYNREWLTELGYHCIRFSITNWIMMFFFLVLYALIYVGLYIWMFHHYRLPWDKAYDRCVNDLETLAREWHCSYQCVNLVVFIFLFLFIIGLNYILVQLIGVNMFIVRFWQTDCIQ